MALGPSGHEHRLGMMPDHAGHEGDIGI